MFRKTFQIFLVGFVVVITLAAVLFVGQALLMTFLPVHSGGIGAVSGGISFSILKVIVPVLMALLIAAVYIFTRPRFR